MRPALEIVLVDIQQLLTIKGYHIFNFWGIILKFGLMVKLSKYTLDFNEKKGKWDLENDKTNRVVKSFENKYDATARGVLKKALGEDGGSVKIQKRNGKYEEERTFPKSRDPISSKG